MKLINFNCRKDFGTEYYLQLIQLGKHLPRPLKDKTVFQIAVSFDDYASWPYIQLTAGSNGLLGMLLAVHRFSLSFDLIAHTWNYNYLENSYDEEETDLG